MFFCSFGKLIAVEDDEKTEKQSQTSDDLIRILVKRMDELILIIYEVVQRINILASANG